MHRHAALARGKHGEAAAEVLSTLSREPGRADRITAALAGELDAPAADTATRIRLTQALVELAGPAAQEALRGLAHDDDHAVALVASAFVGLLEERSRQDRVEDP